MSKKRRWNRRSISFRRHVFERIYRHCEAQGIPVAQWMDRVVTAALDEAGAPQVSREEADAVHAERYPGRTRTVPDVPACFTF